MREETKKFLIEKKVYFNSNKIFTFKIPKYNSKMWVFKDIDDVEVYETKLNDCELIRINGDFNFVLYYVDSNCDYWMNTKCYFNKKEMEEEKARRLNIKYNIQLIEE